MDKINIFNKYYSIQIENILSNIFKSFDNFSNLIKIINYDDLNNNDEVNNNIYYDYLIITIDCYLIN